MAVDEITRLPNLGDDQIARHTATLEQAFEVDAAAPVVTLDRAALPVAQQIAGAGAVWSGAAAERPVPVVITWTAPAPLTVTVQCAGVTLAHVTPEIAATRWSGQTAKGDLCSVAVGDASSSGAIRVCGEQVATWATGQPGPFAFTATSAGCPADTAVTGIERIETEMVNLLPGSPFINEVPAGQLLHLPLNDGTQAGGGVDLSATCQAGTIPARATAPAARPPSSPARRAAAFTSTA